MSQLTDSLLESYSIVAEAAAQKVPTTLTLEVKIKSLDDPGTGAYTVEYLGNTFTAHNMNTEITYPEDTDVYILVPNGDFTREKIIIGSTAPNSIFYASEEVAEYVDVSGPIFSNSNGLITLKTFNSNMEESLTNAISDISVVISQYLKKYRTFHLKCDIKTNIPEDRIGFNGNYGIKLRIPVRYIDSLADAFGDPTDLYQDFILDTKNIIGDPCRLYDWSSQNIYFTLNSAYNYDDTRGMDFSVFVEDFPINDDNDIEDIFIDNLSLSIANTIPEDQKQGYFLSLTATQGEYFGGYFQAEKQIIPTLYINGRRTDYTKTLCYWFRAHDNIQRGDDGFFVHGGNNWECLNEKVSSYEDDDGYNAFSYASNNYTLTVKQEDVPVSMTYKCVMIYEGTLISATIDITNLNSQFTIDLFSLTGSNEYIKDVGMAQLAVDISYQGLYPNINRLGTFKYEWNRDDITLVKINEKLPSEDGTQKVRATFEFPVENIDDIAEVSCSISYLSDENADYRLIGSKNIILTTLDNVKYKLNIIDGNVRLYKYDADGDSPRVANYDGPAGSIISAIPPLDFKLFRADGKELTEAEYKCCTIQWFVPKRSLLQLKDKNNVDKESDDRYYIVRRVGKEGSSLPYDIASFYDSSKTDNTILLRINFGNDVIEEAIPFIFTKDGENGTNGTKYTAVIMYSNDDGQSEYYPICDDEKLRFLCFIDRQDSVNKKIWKAYSQNSNKISDENISNKLKVRLYCNGEEVTDTSKFDVSWKLFDSNESWNKVQYFSLLSTPDKSIIEVNPSSPKDFNQQNVICTIVEADVTIKGTNGVADKTQQVIRAYYPIEVTLIRNVQIGNNLTTPGVKVPALKGGYYSVLYNSDGTNPKYDTTSPFDCTFDLIERDENGIDLKYHWIAEQEGSFANTKSDLSESKSTKVITPISQYSGENNKNYVGVQIEFKPQALNAQIATVQDKLNELNNTLNDFNDDKEILEAFQQSIKRNYEEYLREKQSKNSGLIILLQQLCEEVLGTLQSDGLIVGEYNRYLTFISKYFHKMKVLNRKLSTEEEKIEAEQSCSDLDNFIGALSYFYHNSDYEVTIMNGEVEEKAISLALLEKVFFEIVNRTEVNGNALKDYYEEQITNLNTSIAEEEENLSQLQEVFDSQSYSITHYRPILFLYNTYGMSNLNAWDGNKLYIDENGDYLLAPQMGAGTKNTKDNTFTGIIMGVENVTNTSSNYNDGHNAQENRVGLFGYSRGLRSIFLDADSGNAIFGKNGEGQIQLIPGGTSTIAGWKISQDSITKDNYTTKINWDSKPTKGQDQFLLGLFSDSGKVSQADPNNSGENHPVAILAQRTYSNNESNKDKKGTVNTIAIGYDGWFMSDSGNIGGWVIDKTRLSRTQSNIGTAGMLSGVKDPEKNIDTTFKIFGKTIDDENENVITEGDTAKHTIAFISSNTTNIDKFNNTAPSGVKMFAVGYDGWFTANHGNIGGWTFNNSKLIGQANSNNRIVLDANGDIAQQKYSGGSWKEGNWKITRDGNGEFKTGHIAGWELANDRIQNDKKTTILYASGKIECVELVAQNEGYIGAWQINKNGLTNGTLELNQNSIKGTGFQLDKNGLTTLSGGKIGAGNNGFNFSPTGKATWSGDINANAGTIGEWTIDKAQIKSREGSSYIAADGNIYFKNSSHSFGCTASGISLDDKYIEAKTIDIPVSVNLTTGEMKTIKQTVFAPSGGSN